MHRAFSVPVPATKLVGRASERRKLRTLFNRNDTRLVTLTGPGGIGKTRLAQEVALALSKHGSYRCSFLGLEAVRNASEMIALVASSFGIESDDAAVVLGALSADHPDEPPVLLVLDNFEHLLQPQPNLPLPAALFVSAMLTANQRLKVLVTSRVRLNVSMEREFAVPALGLPPKNDDEDVQIQRSEASEFFFDRVATVLNDLITTPAVKKEVAEICWLLDGLPLALELAAAQTRRFSPTELRQRLEQGLVILRIDRVGVPARLRSMESAVGWSYDLLSPPAQELFRRLGVFSGGFTWEAAEAVALATLDSLTELLDANLIYRMGRSSANDDVTRFAMLETIGSFARQLLAGDQSEFSGVNWRLVNWLLSWTESANELFWGASEINIRNLFEEELPNIRSALSWLVEQCDADQAQRLAASIGRFWHMRTLYLAEGVIWLRKALFLDGASPSVRLRAMSAQILLSLPFATVDAIEHWLEEAEELSVGVAEAEILIDFWYVGATVCLFTNEFERGNDYIRRFESQGTFFQKSPHAALRFQFLRGGLLQIHGNLHDAERLYAEIQPMVDSNYGPFFVNVLGMQRAEIFGALGDVDAALERYAKCLVDNVTHRASWQVGRCFAKIGVFLGVQQRWVESARALGSSEAICNRIGLPMMPHDIAQMDSVIVDGINAIGDAAWRQAWEAGRRRSQRESISETLRGIARSDSGDPRELAPRAINPYELTRREQEVLTLLVTEASISDLEIARSLGGLSVRTAEDHLRKIRGKLGVTSREQIIALANREHLVPEE